MQWAAVKVAAPNAQLCNYMMEVDVQGHVYNHQSTVCFFASICQEATSVTGYTARALKVAGMSLSHPVFLAA